MERFVSDPFDIADLAVAELSRVDLVFYGVDHSGDSYTARVFVNNARATVTTPMTAAAGYAGSFTVLGHGNCYGDDGHCEPRARTTDEFDRRAPHALEPQTKVVVITDALTRVRGASLTVTVVAVDGRSKRVKASDAMAFEHLRLAAYDGYGDAGPTPRRRPATGPRSRAAR